MSSLNIPIDPDEDPEDDAVNYPAGWHWTTEAANQAPGNVP